MDELERLTVNGYTVRIYPDLEPESPRDWTHGAELALFHRRYDLPNDSGLTESDLDALGSWQALAENLKAGGALAVLPVFMLDHSGLYLKVGDDLTERRAGSGVFLSDPQGWDSGQAGFAYVTPQNWADTQGTEWTGSEEQIQRAHDLIRSDVAEYAQYLEGDVYGYVIEDAEGEHRDSLWGLFGYDYAVEEARGAAEAMPAAASETARKRESKITELAARLGTVIDEYAGLTLGTARTEGLARKLAETALG